MDTRGTEDLDGYLMQADCPDELRIRCIELARDRRAAEVVPQLAAHRMGLLAASRAACARLECLDRAIHLITSD